MTSSATLIPSMATTPTLKTCYYYTSFKVGDVDIHIPPTMLNLSNQPSDREAPLSNSVKETLEDDHCHEDGAMDDTNVVSVGAMLGVPPQSLDDIDSCDQELQVQDSCIEEDFEGDDQCTKEEVMDDTVVSEGAMLGVTAESLDPITWDVTFVEELGHELIVLPINDQQDIGSCDQEQLVQNSCTKEDLVGDASSNSAMGEVSIESTSSVTRTTVTPDVDLTDSKILENQEVQCHALKIKGDSEILENQQVQNSCNEDLVGDTSSKGVMDEVSIELTSSVITIAAATTTTSNVNLTNGGIFESQEAQCRSLESNTKVDVVGKDKGKGEEKNVPKEERTILLTFVRKRRKQRVGVSKDDLEKYIISKFGDNVIEEIHLRGGDDQPHDVEVIMKNLSAMNSVLQNQRETTLAIKGMPKILAQRKLVRNKSYFGF